MQDKVERSVLAEPISGERSPQTVPGALSGHPIHEAIWFRSLICALPPSGWFQLSRVTFQMAGPAGDMEISSTESWACSVDEWCTFDRTGNFQSQANSQLPPPANEL